MSISTMVDHYILILIIPLPLVPSFLSFYLYHFDTSFFLTAIIHCVFSAK